MTTRDEGQENAAELGLAAARLVAGVCPRCGSEVWALEHHEGLTRYDFARSAVPRIETRRPTWSVTHPDGTTCEVSPAVARAVLAEALDRMRRSA